MPARERERGELPSPIWSLLDRKVEWGLYVFAVIGPPRIAVDIAAVPIQRVLPIALFLPNIGGKL